VMKVMVCGKGGAGKTVVTVLMGKILSEHLKVYVVDSDESNIVLPFFLGVSPPKPLVEFVGGKRDEEEFERMEPDIAKALSMAKEGIRLDLLPPEYVSFSPEGVGLLTIGKVREYGEGCACPFNILTRILLGNLVLKDEEIVLVDTDAGVEHVGRGVEETCDAILAVVDPTVESLEVAALLRDIASSLGKRFWVVANKVTREVEGPLREEAARLNLKIDGAVRFDERVYLSCLKREPLKAETAITDLRRVMQKINLI